MHPYRVELTMELCMKYPKSLASKHEGVSVRSFCEYEKIGEPQKDWLLYGSRRGAQELSAADANGKRAFLGDSMALHLLSCLLLASASALQGSCAWKVTSGLCSVDDDGCIVSTNFPKEYPNDDSCVIEVEAGERTPWCLVGNGGMDP